MTNEELFEIVENHTRIPKKVTDIFLELDTTPSVTTQASLNHLLGKLYERLKRNEEIIIEHLGDAPCKAEAFKQWVEDHFDNYSIGLFIKDHKK